MTPNSKLLTVHIADAPEVTKAAQQQEERIEAQSARISALLQENRRRSERVAALESEAGQRGTAERAATFAHSLLNRH
jgi:hypothetical protein